MNKLGYLLGVAACGALAACATGKGDVNRASVASAPVDSVATAGASEDAGVRLTGLTVAGDERQTVVQLTALGSLSIYSSYNPEPSLVVVDVPNGEYDPGLTERLASDSRIRSIRMNRLTEFGRPFARLEVRLADGVEAEVRRDGKGIDVTITGGASRVPAETVAVAASPVVTTEPLPPATSEVMEPKGDSTQIAVNSAPSVVIPEQEPKTPPVAVTAKSSEPATASIAPAVERRVVTGTASRVAHRLDQVRAALKGEDTVIEFAGDGGFQVNDFFLANPNRLVFDLDGVTNGFAKKTIEVGHNGIGRVRISQFQMTPKPICRIVLDLEQPLPYRIETGNRGTRLVLSSRATAPSQGVVAEKSAPAPAAPAATVAVLETPQVQNPVPAIEEPVSTKAAEPEPKAPVTETIVIAAANPAEPSLAPAKTAIAPPASAAKAVTNKKSTAEEDALFEAAEAYVATAKDPEVSGGKYETKTVSTTEQTYVGEPISLHLKDSDIRDVLRTISTLTGLNIVVDPDVSGKVTIDLEEVPWDQALELILKVNNLNYQLDGNVMRIGQTVKLQREEQEKRKLAEEKELSQPQQTVIKTLSYAKAADLQPLIQHVMSRRGSVIVDPRTNDLIISDIKEYVQSALTLIDSLDIPNKQVVIEARIVETTKEFSKKIGILWGFSGVADTAHGNASNLKFPNSGLIEGGVGLLPSSANGAIGLTLGSILDTFNLDIALQAAESEGMVKIVSSPKVATETNYQAIIQSGVQIPVQTTSNNTTTVQYIDATLKLTVTPQITAQGTVIMEIAVQKRAPLLILLPGATNAALSTREAKTRLMVKDGGTAVIGGIYEITDDDNSNRVPGLWKIPFLGNLFKNSAKDKKHDELLIFITPRVVKG